MDVNYFCVIKLPKDHIMYYLYIT